MDVHSYVDGFIRRKRIRLKACEERRERALAAAKEAAAFLADAGATKGNPVRFTRKRKRIRTA